MNNANDFRIAAENAGVEEIYEDGSQEFSMNEDDGAFFVEQFGLRACFSTPRGQESTRREFNREANDILRAMGYSVRYNGSGIV